MIKSKYRIALISDLLTYESLKVDCEIKVIGPLNYQWAFRTWRPDYLLVESAWQGINDKWKFKIAKYPDHPERDNHRLIRVIEDAKKLGIPTVFWNKEDGVHFDRFIESAKHFDHVFTVDENCVSKYKQVIGAEASISVLPFPIQTQIHNFTGFNFKDRKANFVGSYSHHIHENRRVWQNQMFQCTEDLAIDTLVYDRNSNRKSDNYRYPGYSNLTILPAVPYQRTAEIYKQHLVSLNVNTIEDSKTMYSRRLIEIIACGGFAVTNKTPSVDHFFRDFCFPVSDKEELSDVLKKLTKGPSKADFERVRAGAAYVSNHYSWLSRLDDIAKKIEL